MAVGTLVSLEEYLATSYDPDVEYVDGVLVERNVGNWLHSLIQRNIIIALSRKYPQIYAVPELRIRLKHAIDYPTSVFCCLPLRPNTCSSPPIS